MDVDWETPRERVANKSRAAAGSVDLQSQTHSIVSVREQSEEITAVGVEVRMDQNTVAPEPFLHLRTR